MGVENDDATAIWRRFVTLVTGFGFQARPCSSFAHILTPWGVEAGALLEFSKRRRKTYCTSGIRLIPVRPAGNHYHR